MSVWVSASDVPSVLHANPFASRRALWAWKVGAKRRPEYTGPAVEHGKLGEVEAINAIKGQFPGHEFYQPGTVIAVDPGVKLSCSPDLVQLDGEGKFVGGWEVKTPWSRVIPERADDVYWEHVWQALANSLVFCGRGNWLFWNLYYHDREHPQFNPAHRFVLTANPRSSELLATEIDRFNQAVGAVNCAEGQQTKKQRTPKQLRDYQELQSGVQITQCPTTAPTADKNSAYSSPL